MERHLTTDVSIFVALMAAHRAAQPRPDLAAILRRAHPPACSPISTPLCPSLDVANDPPTNLPSKVIAAG